MNRHPWWVWAWMLASAVVWVLVFIAVAEDSHW